MIDKIQNKTITANWNISEQEIKDISKEIYEAPLSEEDRIIERLKYTKKELDSMYAKSLADTLGNEMSKVIADEIDKELLQELSRIVGYVKRNT